MKKFWEIWNAVLDKSLDIGYAISDKVSEGVDKLMKRSQESNQARKLSGWMRSHKEEGLELPSVEGVVYTKKGNISAKTGKEVLNTLETALIGTAKQLEKKSPEEYVRRIEAHKARVRADEIDTAFKEFKNWYNGDDSVIIGKLKKEDPTFRSTLHMMGSIYRNGIDGEVDARELLKQGMLEVQEAVEEDKNRR